jgi:hypothetical protein
MAALVKFQKFVRDLGLGVHNLDTGAIKIYLSNAAPDVALDAIKTDLAEIATGSGYTGPVDITAAWSESAGTATLTATDVTITAAGGSIGPFRYVVMFNDTPASPLDPLIAYWDYGSAITLADTETFTTDFGASVLTLT